MTCGRRHPPRWQPFACRFVTILVATVVSIAAAIGDPIPASIVILTSPTDGVSAGEEFTFSVELVDANGDRVTEGVYANDDGNLVTVEFSYDEGYDPVSVDLVLEDGVATTDAPGATLTRAGRVTPQVTSAEPNVVTVVGDAFDVAASEPLEFAFLMQPDDLEVGAPWSPSGFHPPPYAVLLDAYGNLVEDAPDPALFKVVDALGNELPGLEVAEGTTTTSWNDGGFYTLDCVWFSRPIAAARLVVQDGVHLPATSDPFDVTGSAIRVHTFADPFAVGVEGPAAVDLSGVEVTLADGENPVTFVLGATYEPGASNDGGTCTPVTGTTALTDSTGVAELLGLSAGSYTLGIDETQGSVAGHVLLTDLADDVQITSNARADVAVAFYAGALITGTVIVDDGRGGGTSANVERDGAEGTLADVMVTVTEGANVHRALSGAEGAWLLPVPLARERGSVDLYLHHGYGVATGHALDGVVDRSSAGSAGEIVALTLSAGDATIVDLGVADALRVWAGREQATSSPGRATFPVAVQPGVDGAVGLALEGSSDPWTFTLDHAACTSVLTVSATGDGVVLVPSDTDTPWPREEDGRHASCAGTVSVAVSSGVGVGTILSFDLVATLAWQHASVTEEAAPVRLTAVVLEHAGVVLTLDASDEAGAFDDRTTVRPGDTVTYRVRFENRSVDAIDGFEVHLPIDARFALPSNAASAGLAADLVCPNGAEVTTTLPYDADARSVTLDLASPSTCDQASFAPGTSGELRLDLELK